MKPLLCGSIFTTQKGRGATGARNQNAPKRQKVQDIIKLPGDSWVPSD